MSPAFTERALFPTPPAGVKMLIAGAHETLKRLTEKGGGGHPDICVGDKYARKAKQRKGGEGGRGAVAELVARIFGVSSRTAISGGESVRL